MDIIIEKLTAENFTAHSLDDFRRRQQVIEVWGRTENGMELVREPFTEDWEPELRRNVAARMLGNLERGYFGTGAFDSGKLIGWTFYGSELIGERKNYVELHMFHVSEPYRGMGIGRRLFETALAACGAGKMTVNSSPYAVPVYHRLGFRDTGAEQVTDGLRFTPMERPAD